MHRPPPDDVVVAAAATAATNAQFWHTIFEIHIDTFVLSIVAR